MRETDDGAFGLGSLCNRTELENSGQWLRRNAGSSALSNGNCNKCKEIGDLANLSSRVNVFVYLPVMSFHLLTPSSTNV